MESSLLDREIPRYLAPSIALFEVVDDDLLPIRPIGIQVLSSNVLVKTAGLYWVILFH